jgi:hypothetical protein
MMDQIITQYVHTLFEESRDGSLTVGSGIDRFDYDVAWDVQTAEYLAQECASLVEQLTRLACQYDKLLHTTRHLTKQEMEVYNTYLRPFPNHGMDENVLRAIWEKEAIGLALQGWEGELSREYNRWYQEQALKRLPWRGCAPTDLICRARRYARLVQLNAPAPVCEYEARCLAEEYVLYHCMA